MKRMVRGLFAAVAALVLAAAVAACKNNTEPTPIPIAIAPATVTENFSGTLFVSGSNLHIFAVAKDGEVHVTLTAVSTIAVDADPNAVPPVAAIPAAPVTVPMTLTVGQPALTTLGVQCSSLKQTAVLPGAREQLSGQALAGSFCVSISDPNGELPRAASYAITVTHS